MAQTNEPLGTSGATIGIDFAALKLRVNGAAVSVLDRRLKRTGRADANEVPYINTHRGEERASAAWNTSKGLFCDKGDPSYDGDLVHVVAKIDGIGVAEAAQRIADEAGIERPRRQTQPVKQGRLYSRTKGHPFSTAHASSPETSNHTNGESVDERIRRAQMLFADAGPVLGTPGEAYALARSIVLPCEQPWLRFVRDLAWYVHDETRADRDPQKYPLVGRFPALVAGATVAGQGQVVAVAKIYFGLTADGDVVQKPGILNPLTGQAFKKNKLTRGVMHGAGIFFGLHLAELADTLVVCEGVEDALCAVMAGYPAAARAGSGLGGMVLPDWVSASYLPVTPTSAGSAPSRRPRPPT